MLNQDLIGSTSSFTYKTSEGLVVLDLTGKILYANPFVHEILGYPEGGMEGKFCFETCRGEDLSGNRYCFANCAVLEMAKRDELVRNFDIQLVNQSGKRIWLNVTTLLESSSTYNNAGSRIIHIFRLTSTPPVDMEAYFRKSVSDFMEASARKNQEALSSSQKGSQVAGIAKKFLLSPRETEVFQFLTRGYGTPEIAGVLEVSPTTVRTHVQRVLKKLQVHSMLEAVALALGERTNAE